MSKYRRKNVQVGKDQERRNQKKFPTPKTEVGKKNLQSGTYTMKTYRKKVQVGKDQEKAQSEKDSHSKNQDGKKLN